MNGTDPIALLKEFAAERKKRIQPCESYDSNVSSSTINKSTGFHPQLTSGYKFTQEIRMKNRGRRVHITASEEYMRLSVEGHLDEGLFSINRANRILFVDVPSDRTVSGDPSWPVFVPRQKSQSAAPSKLLDLPCFHAAVSQLIRSRDDSIHICKDSIFVYFHPDSLDALQLAIESLSEFVGARTRMSKRSLHSLPERFAPLVPSIQKWAESDDGWRAEMLSRVPKLDIAKLLETVEPFLSQIHEYLDEHDDEAACALGRLAELVAEARMQRRNPEN
jgi:hypothetical protein